MAYFDLASARIIIVFLFNIAIVIKVTTSALVINVTTHINVTSPLSST